MSLGRKGFEVLGVFLLGVCALYALSGLYSIGPQQRGVLQRFGRIVDAHIPPGIHYHWPWPLESVIRLDTTSVRTLEVRFRSPKGTAERERQGEVLTGDENMVETWLKVNYSVAEAGRYLFAATDVEAVLERLIEAATVQAASRMQVDDMLTDGKGALQRAIREDLSQACNRLALGVHISAVQLQKVDPPFDVMFAFQDVASAREDRHKMIQNAEGERDSKLPEARAQANRLRREAQTDARIARSAAEGEATRFQTALQAFMQSPRLNSDRLWISAMEQCLTQTDKVIIDPTAESQNKENAR